MCAHQLEGCTVWPFSTTHTLTLTHSIHLVGTQKLYVSIGTIMIRSGALAPRGRLVLTINWEPQEKSVLSSVGMAGWFSAPGPEGATPMRMKHMEDLAGKRASSWKRSLELMRQSWPSSATTQCGSLRRSGTSMPSRTQSRRSRQRRRSCRSPRINSSRRPPRSSRACSAGRRS